MCSSMRFYIGVGHFGAARPCAQPRTSLPAVGTHTFLHWPPCSGRRRRFGSLSQRLRRDRQQRTAGPSPRRSFGIIATCDRGAYDSKEQS